MTYRIVYISRVKYSVIINSQKKRVHTYVYVDYNRAINSEQSRARATEGELLPTDRCTAYNNIARMASPSSFVDVFIFDFIHVLYMPVLIAPNECSKYDANMQIDPNIHLMILLITRVSFHYVTIGRRFFCHHTYVCYRH